MKSLVGKAVLVISALFTLASVNLAQQQLTILHVNDTHSCLAPIGTKNSNMEGTIGGIARAATMIKVYQWKETNVLTVHAGDLFIGDLFFNLYMGVPELQIMKSLGFDAMAVGNHEFDLTPDALLGSLSTAFSEGGFPLLSSNAVIEDEKVAPLKNFIQPYTIKEYYGFKVGIFALTTPDANTFSLPAPVILDNNVAQKAALMVRTLQSQGCKVIVCLSHLGIAYDEMLAESIPGINVIISAHDHIATEKPVVVKNKVYGNTYIAQADAFFTHLGRMKLEIWPTEVKLLEYELIPLDETIWEDETVKANVNELIAGLEAQFGMPLYTQPVAEATDDFEELANPGKNKKWETPVGKLVTDAFRTATGTDIAITTGGSTAQKLYAGPITASDIFRMIGYGFNTVNGLGYIIATFKITSAELWKGLEVCVSSAEYNDELLAQVSGMSYEFDLKNPVGSRVTSVLINGKMIDPAATYTVTANEFLVTALPMFGVEITDVKLIEDVTEFQIVLNYVVEKGVISPDEKKLSKSETESTSKNLPTEFKLEQNYPNPFNPSTSIQFSIPVSGYTTLKVFNVLGQEVATLVNSQLNAGTHKYEFNAKGLTSGVYIYRLQSGKYIQTNKMLLAK